MKKNILGIASIVSAYLLSSCAVSLPVDVSNASVGTKTGSSKTTVLFGCIYTNKDYGVADAVKNGKLSGGVATIDLKKTNLIIIQKRELIVTGE